MLQYKKVYFDYSSMTYKLIPLTILAVITVYLIETYPLKPVQTLWIFAVPFIFYALTHKFGNPKLSNELLAPLFSFALIFYAFGGHLFQQNAQKPKNVANIVNIEELTTIVEQNKSFLPSKTDELTTLLDINVLEGSDEYILTLQLHDIDVDNTNLELLNSTLSDGLKGQCQHKGYRNLHKLGIKVSYQYVDDNKRHIGTHKADLSACKKSKTINSEA